MLYLCVLHYENIAEDSVQVTAISLRAVHNAFGYYYVILFSHASDFDRGASYESVIFNFIVKRFFAYDMERARYHPFNVLRETRQDLG